MSNPVRFGIVGCGGIAEFHAQAVQAIPEARLVAACSGSFDGAKRFAAAHPGVIPCESLDALLARDDVDAVCICTPSGLHTPQAIAAMRAGKHVVCEKPMSLTLEEADALIAAEQETGAKVCIISQFRFTPAVREIRRALDVGALGRIVSGSLSMKYFRSHEYYASAAWRGTWALDGGGALMNQGIHGVDVFRHLMGPVRSVHALTRTLTRRIEVEDSAAAVLEFENGAIGTLEASTTCCPGYPRRIEICGDAGSVVLEEDSIVRWDLPIPCALPVGQAATNVGTADPKAISYTGHMLQIRNFVDAILRGTPLTADAQTGRTPLEIIMAVYESSRNGKTVFLGGASNA